MAPPCPNWSHMERYWVVKYGADGTPVWSSARCTKCSPTT